MWNAPAPRGLREAGVAEVVQQHARFRAHAHGVGKIGSRLGVEIQRSSSGWSTSSLRTGHG